MSDPTTGHRAAGFCPALLLVTISLASGAAAAAQVVREPPPEIAPDRPILFYLHGQIVEGSDGRPIHPEHGPYEYRAVADALAERGFLVVTEIRPAGAVVAEAAERVVTQIEALLARGVMAGRIGVVGHSKGGVIARAVSERLARDDLAFVLLAGCFAFDEERPQALHGRILSLVERDDRVAVPCLPRFRRLETGGIREERLLELGGGHGLFYRPVGGWVDAVSHFLQEER